MIVKVDFYIVILDIVADPYQFCRLFDQRFKVLDLICIQYIHINLSEPSV